LKKQFFMGGFMPKKWRRRKEKDTWHFCINCSNWPTQDYVEQLTKPTSGEFCDECLAKEKKSECKEA